MFVVGKKDKVLRMNSEAVTSVKISRIVNEHPETSVTVAEVNECLWLIVMQITSGSHNTQIPICPYC